MTVSYFGFISDGKPCCSLIVGYIYDVVHGGTQVISLVLKICVSFASSTMNDFWNH